MKRSEKACELFDSNFNCAQSVLAVFSEELGLNRETALKIATCFGGGIRCGEVCGAVSGAVMALGLKYGHYDSFDLETKMKAYEKTRMFIDAFKAKNGSVCCRDLLGYDIGKPEDQKTIKEKGLFKTVCPGMVADAVNILETII